MGIDPVIYIRADGNKQIATGHLMRCLTIGRACRIQGAAVSFLAADQESEEILRDRFERPGEFPVIRLESDYKNLEQELSFLLLILSRQKVDLLLIDSYFVTEHYLASLSRLVKTAYIDDLYSFPYPVDTIINYDFQPDTSCYEKAASKLLGLSYVPLRREFCEKKYKPKKELSQVLITSGGTLLTETLLPLLEELLRHPKESPSLAFHLLAGPASGFSPELSKFCSSHPELTLHDYTRNMADFLCQFDLVLSAAGTTLYELCALGIPAISYIAADNQTQCGIDFEKAGLIPCIGTISSQPKEAFEKLHTCLQALLDFAVRSDRSKQMKQQIDGQGAMRIAAHLLPGKENT